MATALNRPIAMKLVMMIFVACIVTGCTSFFQDTVDQPVQQTPLSTAFIEARTLYEQGDYAESLKLFNHLAITGDNDEIVFNAKLGETCCRLMLATTPIEYYTAIGMWNDLGGANSDNTPALNFDMIDPVIVRLTTEQIQKDLELNRAQASKKEKNVPSDETKIKIIKDQSKKTKIENQEVKAELSALKEKVKEADTLQHQLEKMEAENRSLKEKIKALEAIDQNIQKKKTEIESPGE